MSKTSLEVLLTLAEEQGKEAHNVLGDFPEVTMLRNTVAHMGGLLRLTQALIRNLRRFQCGCSLKERDSGHRIGCAMPDILEMAGRIEFSMPICGFEVDEGVCCVMSHGHDGRHHDGLGMWWDGAPKERGPTREALLPVGESGKPKGGRNECSTS